MALFAYKGRAGGGAVTGEIEADSRPAAVTALRAKGVIATSVQEKAVKAAAAAAPKKFGGKVRDKDLAIYTRQFSTMVDAGLPIAQCLQILSEQNDSKTLREVTARIAVDVQGGATLAESFSKYPRTFDHLFTNMLASANRAACSTSCSSGSPGTSKRRPSSRARSRARWSTRSPSSASPASSSSS